MKGVLKERKIHCKYDELILVDKLKPHPKNRNKHPDDQIERLAKILKYQGIRAPIVVSKRSNKIVKGHGTLMAIKANQWDTAPIVYQDFEDDDQEWLFVQSDNAIANWAELDIKGINADLSELGPFDIDLIGIKNFTVDVSEKNKEEDPYSNKIKVPIYEVTGEKPETQELFDETKTRELKDRIITSNLSTEEKEFLLKAADRHTVFNYAKIAEYYAHADKEAQELMEESALVIIDFNKAIENGFIELSKELAELYQKSKKAEKKEPKIILRKKRVIDSVDETDLSNLIELAAPLLGNDLDKDDIKLNALEMLSHHKKNIELDSTNKIMQLQKRWYDSLDKPEPDYSVYSDPYYLSDVWTCWVCYSRNAVKALFNEKSLIDKSVISLINPNGLIVDAGAGISYTTAAIKELLPTARVVATNLEDTWQFKLAKKLSETHDFEIYPSFDGLKNVDLFFASEYFEHIKNPLEHLVSVVETCNPKVMVIANGFNGISIGHFTEYLDGGNTYSNTEMSKMFWNKLRNLGYVKQETKIWNNRPSVWVR